jgi:hypothetical protein
MDAPLVGTMIAFLTLAGGMISVWVSLRERLVRAETKIEVLERLHGDQRTDVQALRDWLNEQFQELRRSMDRKADKQ